MATYVIGDIQGCLAEFESLLKVIDYSETRDKLMFCGDLVNRGPDSLGVLRLVSQLGERNVITLGNHDLHLLAIVYGNAKPKAKDTLQPVLDAPDCKALCQWLKSQKLMHHDPDRKIILVHAGIAPAWRVEEALSYAAEVEQVLHQGKAKDFFERMYGNKPDSWDPSLKKWKRLRFITNAFTRIRYCTKDGVLSFTDKGPVGSQPAEFFPWFHMINNISSETKILFGHWAALGGFTGVKNIIALDTGCVWGNRLSALRLEDNTFFSVNARKAYA